jgi:Ca-activated chloride channel family protein
MKKYIYLLIIFMCCCATNLFAQNRTITGKVADKGNNEALVGATITIKGTKIGTNTNVEGNYKLVVPNDPKTVLVYSFISYKTVEYQIKSDSIINVFLDEDGNSLQEVAVISSDKKEKKKSTEQPNGDGLSFIVNAEAFKTSGPRPSKSDILKAQILRDTKPTQKPNTEEYDKTTENNFVSPLKTPFSTFSIDVDKASYSNIRRFLELGELPPTDAVRIEEMVNYFAYNYPQPTNDKPFAVSAELSACAWNPQHQLLQIGLQGRKIPTDKFPASNLVFLIDVSGSMSATNKLPLLKSAFSLLVDQLRPQDKVAIVVYAGAAGEILAPTSGSEKQTIKGALNNLQAGGSTAGGEGIELAYNLAKKYFVEGGNNRVILATDGDFNVGVSSKGSLEELIEEKRKTGIFLTVLGFGMNNYKDNKMETLADKGNGNYAYIDNIQEAEKTLITEFGGTLFTIAKDVKMQVEFNPTKVKGYRLIGYENRALKTEDFNDDKKDAGELGSGHTVTAFYEIIPSSVTNDTLMSKVDESKYQQTVISKDAYKNGELLTLKLRYKKPDGNVSELIETVVADTNTKLDKTSENFRFASAVVEFGLLLRNSQFKSNANYEQVIEMAKQAKGADDESYRAEFVKLAKTAKRIAESNKK